MKLNFIFMGFVAMAFIGCSSSKAVQQAATSGEVEIVVPCSGVEFITSAEYFRSNAVGMSSNMELANQKAMSAARTKLAAAIETTIKAVTDSYISSYEHNGLEESRSRFQSLTREAVNQKLSGIRVICQKTMQSENGQFKCYVAVELSGGDIVDAIKSGVDNDSKLRTDFEYSKFQETFNQEMAALAASR